MVRMLSANRRIPVEFSGLKLVECIPALKENSEVSEDIEENAF